MVLAFGMAERRDARQQHHKQPPVGFRCTATYGNLIKYYIHYATPNFCHHLSYAVRNHFVSNVKYPKADFTKTWQKLSFNYNKAINYNPI